MPQPRESLIDKIAATVDISSVPDYIKDYVPEDDLRRRLALRDPRLVDVASAVVSKALNTGQLAPKEAHDIVFYNVCFNDGVTDGK